VKAIRIKKTELKNIIFAFMLKFFPAAEMFLITPKNVYRK